MLKLFLPDVGPMPLTHDWASMSDEQLANELAARGQDPLPLITHKVRKLVELETQELYEWMLKVADNRGPNYSHLSLLQPILIRRYKMGLEQIETVRQRWIDSVINGLEAKYANDAEGLRAMLRTVQATDVTLDEAGNVSFANGNARELEFVSTETDLR